MTDRQEINLLDQFWIEVEFKHGGCECGRVARDLTGKCQLSELGKVYIPPRSCLGLLVFKQLIEPVRNLHELGGLGQSFDSGVQRYTVYKSFLDLDIRRRGDNAGLFEGHAKARSQTDNLGTLVPNLVEAMFTGFPGRSGETVKITVPPPQRAR